MSAKQTYRRDILLTDVLDAQAQHHLMEDGPSTKALKSVRLDSGSCLPAVRKVYASIALTIHPFLASPHFAMDVHYQSEVEAFLG